jgi:prolyl-tRNA synthetase
MRLSQLFTKTSKNAPADEVSKNAQLLIQAGFVHKEMAGVYTYLPLGLRVLENICSVIREEMDAVGGQELKMTTLQDAELWKQSNRWDDEIVDVWFKTKLQNETELGLGWTHEEPLIRAVKPFIQSYKDLPIIPYQIQTKLRNEVRAKSGVMRGREFLMKDMYTFARSEEEHDELYENIKQAYFRVFERLGIGEQTFITFASGGAFSQFSHEFQTLTEAGEDVIYLNRAQKIAINEEVLTDEVLTQLELKREDLEEVKAAEVGNIFTLKDKFTAPLGLTFTTEDGKELPVMMGCYGIGPSRLVGVIAELLSDDKGLVWPEAVAPAKVYLALLGQDAEVVQAADELYKELTAANISVLYDDRQDARPGEKFADADLMGIPYRVVVSSKTVAAGQYEIKQRTSQDTELLSKEEILKKLA